MHPGPIDNSVLNVGAYGDELRRGMMENKDYVLLPDDVFKMLAKEYTGGPHFGRKVLNKGTDWVPNNFVDLYPIRFEVYLCKQVGSIFSSIKVFRSPYVPLHRNSYYTLILDYSFTDNLSLTLIPVTLFSPPFLGVMIRTSTITPPTQSSPTRSCISHPRSA